MQYDWVVDSSIYDLTVSPVFYFGVNVSNNDGSDSAYQTCHYFNLTARSVTSLSSVIPSSTASTTSTTHPSGSSPTASSASSTAPGINIPIPQPDSSMPTGAIAGISVACTVVVFVAVAGVGFWFWRRKNQNKVEHDQATPLAPLSDNKKEWTQVELASSEIMHHESTPELE